MGYIPDNLDTEDEDEFKVQDMIHDEINSLLKIISE